MVGGGSGAKGSGGHADVARHKHKNGSISTVTGDGEGWRAAYAPMSMRVVRAAARVFLRAAGGGGERRERKGRRGRRRGRRGPGVSRERGGGVGVRESGVFIIAQRGGVGNIIDAAVGVKRT